jgi:hypothetical protein
MSTLSEADSQVLIIVMDGNVARKCVLQDSSVRFKTQKEFRDFVVKCYDKLDLYIGTTVQNMRLHCPEWFEYTDWVRSIDTVSCFSSKFQKSYDRVLFLNTKLEIQE